MLVAKLTTKFRLQAYEGATIINYKNQTFSVFVWSVIGKIVTYIMSIGRRDTHIKKYHSNLITT